MFNPLFMKMNQKNQNELALNFREIATHMLMLDMISDDGEFSLKKIRDVNIREKVAKYASHEFWIIFWEAMSRARGILLAEEMNNANTNDRPKRVSSKQKK